MHPTQDCRGSTRRSPLPHPGLQGQHEEVTCHPILQGQHEEVTHPTQDCLCDSPE